jgi:copper chaperone CopZ
MPTQKFFVNGLRHEDESELTQRLRSIRGVLFAAASHRDACVEVEFEDDAVTTAELREAIAAMGYPAELAG